MADKQFTEINLRILNEDVARLDALAEKVKAASLWGKAGFRPDTIRLMMDITEAALANGVTISDVMQGKYTVRPLKH